MLACYVVNTNSEDGSGKKKCAPMLEDYYECLHHRKEVSNTPRSTNFKDAFLTRHSKQAARVHALQSAYRKHIAANPRDDAPSAGQIRSLGLIEGDLHEKDMKAAALLPHVKTN
jgi:NADH dehydrogenase (ubiquinone) Fe-S protein 5